MNLVTVQKRSIEGLNGDTGLCGNLALKSKLPRWIFAKHLALKSHFGRWFYTKQSHIDAYHPHTVQVLILLKNYLYI